MELMFSFVRSPDFESALRVLDLGKTFVPVTSSTRLRKSSISEFDWSTTL